MELELEDKKQLVKWMEEILCYDDDRISLSYIPYNLREIERELIRRENCEIESIDA
ncbi:MAG: hypothetical protein WA061_02070 [Microgenomates group bacterium]